MELSKERIKEFQDIFEKKYSRKLTWEEASEAAHNLVGLFEVLIDIDMRDRERKDKLKDNPKGFHVTDGVYTCPICGYHISGDQTWYDKHGLKCLDCQRAVDKKILPGSVFKSKESWYSVWEFDYYFKIKSPTVRKFVRQGKLKSRIVPNAQGGKHCEIFLIKDNAGVLPKKPKSFLVKDEDNRVHAEYEPVDISGLTGEDDKKNHINIVASGK